MNARRKLALNLAIRRGIHFMTAVSAQISVHLSLPWLSLAYVRVHNEPREALSSHG